MSDSTANVHPYILSFIRVAGEAGYLAASITVEKPRCAFVELRRGRSKPVRFRVWVESKRRASDWTLADYGYVAVAHDPAIGRERLIDWTNLADRAMFDLKANDAGGSLRRAMI